MQKKAKAQQDRHKFEKIHEFDHALRKLVKVPKEEIERMERESRTPRPDDQK